MSLFQIKKKIDTVRKTAQITNAMKLVSTSKYKQIDKDSQNYDLYSRKVREMVQQIVRAPFYDMPDNLWIYDIQEDVLSYADLLEEAKSDKDRKIGYLVLTADKGLAGNYNNKIISSFEETIKKHHESTDEIVVLGIGRPIIKYCQQNQIELIYENTHLPDYPTFTQVQQIIHEAVQAYQQKQYDVLFIAYHHPINALHSDIRIEPFLPLNRLLNKPFPENETIDYIIEPDNTIVINALLRQYAESQIYGAIIDAKAAEQASRMQTMSKATDNAEDLIENLQQQYNQERQITVTNELLDIINGASMQD